MFDHSVIKLCPFVESCYYFYWSIPATNRHPVLHRQTRLLSGLSFVPRQFSVVPMAPGDPRMRRLFPAADLTGTVLEGLRRLGLVAFVVVSVTLDPRHCRHDPNPRDLRFLRCSLAAAHFPSVRHSAPAVLLVLYFSLLSSTVSHTPEHHSAPSLCTVAPETSDIQHFRGISDESACKCRGLVDSFHSACSSWQS